MTSLKFKAAFAFTVALLLWGRSVAAQPAFGDLIIHEAGLGPVWVGAADVDGDGDADMVAINECWCDGANDHTIAVLRNDGAGDFPAAALAEDRYAPPFSPGVADFCDFDCDGDIDLVVQGSWESHGQAFVLANDGAGHFALAQVLGSPSNTGCCFFDMVVAGDFNSDGYPDLVKSDESANDVTVFMNSPCGTFTSTGSYAPGGPTALCTGDFDGDGDLDVAVAHRSTNDVTLLINDGTGTFTVSSGFPASPGAVGPIASVDLNGDHKLDLVIVNGIYDSVTVLMNSSGGTFAAPTSYFVPDGPKAVVLADLDLDGHTDVATVNYFSYDVSILMNSGLGGLLPPVSYSLGTPPYGPWWVCGGDFNRDGDIDLAVANYNPGKVQVLRNLHSCMARVECPYVEEDVNGDGILNVQDVVQDVNVIFRGGTPTPPRCKSLY